MGLLFTCTVVIILIIGLASQHLNFLKLNLLNIKSVDVRLDKVSCTDEGSVRNFSKLLGQSIIFIDTGKVEKSLKSKYLCIKSIDITRNFPSKVIILVFGRSPKVSLMVLGGDEATSSAGLEDIATPSAQISQTQQGFLVDNEGIIYAKVETSVDVPKIYYNDNNLALGQRPSGIPDILKILDKLTSFNINIASSEVLDGSFIIFPKEGRPKIIFKLNSDLDAKLASLQLILGQAKIDENQLEFIDLRFDKPIVKFAPKKKNG